MQRHHAPASLLEMPRDFASRVADLTFDADDAPALTSNRTGAADDTAAVAPAIVVPAPQTGGNTPVGTGAVPVGVAGVFAGYGFDDADAGRLSGDLEKGALLVVVKATGRSTEAKNILERNGGSSYGSGVGTSASMRGEVH